jgi:hypothetical protein
MEGSIHTFRYLALELFNRKRIDPTFLVKVGYGKGRVSILRDT